MTPDPRHLLIVWHSATGHAEALALALLRGARHPDLEATEVRFLRAREAVADDLAWAHAVVFATPENFGTMSGALKDFFDRTYYPLEGRVGALPCAIVVTAGNDGSGALRDIRRIITGWRLKEVQEPIVNVGAADEAMLARCEELATTLAAGLEAGLW